MAPSPTGRATINKATEEGVSEADRGRLESRWRVLWDHRTNWNELLEKERDWVTFISLHLGKGSKASPPPLSCGLLCRRFWL